MQTELSSTQIAPTDAVERKEVGVQVEPVELRKVPHWRDVVLDVPPIPSDPASPVQPQRSQSVESIMELPVNPSTSAYGSCSSASPRLTAA